MLQNPRLARFTVRAGVTFTAAVWLATALLMAGCGGDGSTPPETDTTGQTSGCTEDTDCATTGQVCDPLTRACVGCLVDAQCAGSAHCLAKACVPFTSCANSLDCTAAKGADGSAQAICDKSIGECTACLTVADCPENHDCTAKACVPFTPCQNSTDCPSDKVCDPATSRCAQCVADADCQNLELCQSGTCRPFVPCQSDKTCTPMGMLCDVPKGICARCLTDADCPDAYNCQKTGVAGSGECVLDVCKQGQGQCAGGKLVTCQTNGGGFTSPQACGPSTTCTAQDGLAACVNWACTPGRHCVGTDLVTCSADGLEVLEQKGCDAGQKCVGDACITTLCTPNATFCEANAVKKCSADGLTTTVQETCAASEVCDAGACKAKVCEAGAAVCDGATPAECNANGTGYTNAKDPCTGGQICAAGKCVSQLCTPATLFCDGSTLKTCAPDGMSVSKSEACGAGTYCGVGKTGDAGCQPQVCAPAQPSCTGTTATTCMPDGSGFAAGGVNCAAQGKVCSGGACVALACDPLTPKFCEGDVAKTCSADGLTATIAKMCGAGMYCEAGYCQIQVCTPNAKFCTANKPAVCNANGSSVTSVGADCGSGATCVDGACQPHVCTPATLFCDGSTLKTCAPDGLSVSKSQLCGGGYYCGPGAGGNAGCQPNVCDPGSPVCSGTTATTCKADGSGLVVGGVDCAANGKVCSGGACVAMPGCGDGVCDGVESAFSCAEDCGALALRYGASCTNSGSQDTCSHGYFCVARSTAAGGPICVADFATWQFLADAHPASDFSGNAYTTVDSKTGLEWANVPSSGTWSAASSVCANSTLAGHNDWRLPTLAELWSLNDFKAADPGNSAATLVWPNAGAAYPANTYWTAVPLKGGSQYWSMLAAIGRILWTTPSSLLNVRCVRTISPPAAATSTPPARFESQSNGLIFDHLLGLTWQTSSSSTALSWQAAVDYCAQNKPGLPGTGWHLPSIRELGSILDTAATAPAAPPIFGIGASATYWSATPWANKAATAWQLQFAQGYSSDSVSTSNTYYAKCVR